MTTTDSRPKDSQQLGSIAATTPAMSVIVVTIDSFATIRRTLEALAAQERAKELEIVFVGPHKEDSGTGQQLFDAFHSCQRIVCDPLRSRSAGLNAGIRVAKAAVVAAVEDHSFVQPGWAAALLRAHDGPYAAVGPVIINANPTCDVSWADILTGYGNHLAPQIGGEVSSLAGHNCSYKRDVLINEFGADLELLLDAELIIHEQMRARGLRLYLEPKAYVSHLNFERLTSWLNAQFLHGRLHCGLRSRHWTAAQRILMVLSIPLIPLVRTLRLYENPALTPLVRRVWPALLLGHLVSAIGESIGCIAGVGLAAQKLCPLEFHRERHFRNTPAVKRGVLIKEPPTAPI